MRVLDRQYGSLNLDNLERNTKTPQQLIQKTVKLAVPAIQANLTLSCVSIICQFMTDQVPFGGWFYRART